MKNQPEQILQYISELSSSLLLKLDLPGGRVDNETKSILKEGIALAQAGILNDAINKFEIVIERSPTYFGARINLIRAYKSNARDLEAIFYGGMAISVAKTPDNQGKIYNLMGLIAEDIFKITGYPSHVKQSIKFYTYAHECNPDDLVPAWNLVEINLLAHTKINATDPTSEFINDAKSRFDYVLDMIRKHRGNSTSKAKEVYEQAVKIFSVFSIDDEILKEKLEKLSFLSSQSDFQSSPFEEKNSIQFVKAALVTITILSSIASTVYAVEGYISPTQEQHQPQKSPTQKIEKQAEGQKRKAEDINVNYHQSKLYIKLPMSGLDHEWENIAGLDHNWEDIG